MNIRRSNYSSGAPLEEKFGYSRVVKVKSYHTAAFKDYVKPTEGGYYAEHFKAVKPLNTVVTVSALSRPTQLLETEMMAVIGCGE